MPIRASAKAKFSAACSNGVLCRAGSMSPLPADLQALALRQGVRLTPRDATRNGNVRLQAKSATPGAAGQGGCGHCACCIRLEILHNSVVATRHHNAVLEDQLSGTRVQIIALQNEMEGLKKDRDLNAARQQEHSGAEAKELAECHRTIAELQRQAAEGLARENARALWTITDRERQDHAQQVEKQMIMEMQKQLAAGQVQIDLSKRRQEEAEEAVEKRRQRVLSCVLSRIIQNKAYAALGCWRENAHYSARRRRLGLRAVARFRNRGAVLVIKRWADSTRHFVLQREKLTRSLRRMMMRCASASFARWRDQAMQQSVSRERAIRAARRMLNTCLSVAWQHWVLQIGLGKSQRASATRVIKLLLNRSLSVAFATWTDRVLSLQRSREVAARCVHRLLQRCLVVAWEEWQERVAEQKDSREHEGMTAQVEHEQAEVFRLREHIAKLELELESIRKILEYRAGKEYQRLVDASMQSAKLDQQPLIHSTESLGEPSSTLHFYVTHKKSSSPFSKRKQAAGLMFASTGSPLPLPTGSPPRSKKRTNRLSATKKAARSSKSPPAADLTLNVTPQKTLLRALDSDSTFALSPDTFPSKMGFHARDSLKSM